MIIVAKVIEAPLVTEYLIRLGTNPILTLHILGFRAFSALKNYFKIQI